MFRQLFGLLSLVIVSCLPVYAEPPPHDPMYDYPVVFEALTKVLNGLKKANPQLIQIALNNPDENANIAGLLECRVCLNVARRALFCLECYSLTLACRIGSKIRRFHSAPGYCGIRPAISAGSTRVLQSDEDSRTAARGIQIPRPA